MKKFWDPEQAGAVSSMLPEQLSVSRGLPCGASVLTAVMSWKQGTVVVVPPGDGTVSVTTRPVTLLSGSRF
jgi:hypothetical protein